MSESWEEKRRLLREQAEKLLASQSAETSPEAHAELERVIHDLSVHQIELELQNEELLRAQQQMQAARDSYARLYNQAPVGYLSLDANGIILQTNQTFADMLGLSASKIVGKTLAEFILPEDRQIFLGRFRSFFNNPQDKSLDMRLAHRPKHAKGDLCVCLTGRLETDDRAPAQTGQRPSLLVIVSDISVQKTMEDVLRQSEELFRLAFENANIGMCLVDLSGKFMKVNQQMSRIFGYNTDEFEQMEVNDITIPSHKYMIHELLEQAASGARQHFTYEKQYLHKAGHVLWGQISSSLVRDGADRPLYLISHIQDITERKQAEDALRQAKAELEAKNQELYQAYVREQLLARTDTLTGINNRRYFFEVAVHEFNAAARYGHPLSAIMFDIDHFKELNDTYGHQAGDDMLRNLAQLTRQHLRDADILARYGGEEFVILLPYTRLKQACLVAERIREKVSAFRLVVNGAEVGITLSLGVAEFDLQTDSLDKLIQRADQAMYEAKNGGRNRTLVFGESILPPT